MDIITGIFIVGITANALGFAVLILTGPIYAWNGDSPRGGAEQGAKRLATIRWLDRTHKTTANEDRE